MKRIAIFRALYLGDMLLAVPALRALRQRFPDAEITLIGLPWALTFVERYAGYLDRLIPFVGYPGIQEVAYRPDSTRAFLAEQRAYEYDVVIQMHGSGLTSNAFVKALGGKMSVGYFPGQVRPASASLTLGVEYPKTQHEIYRNLGLAGLLGCSPLDAHLEFPLTERDFQEVQQLLGALPLDGRPLIGLHPGAKYPARRWPTSYFATLADALANKLHARIIFTGDAHEKPVVQQTIDAMHTRPLNLAGQTSLGGLAALLSKLDLFISNDTGPAHLASALDTPSITLFGPGDSRRWASLDWERHLSVHIPVTCSPCRHVACPIDHRCLDGIQPMFIYELAEDIWQRQSSKRLQEN